MDYSFDAAKVLQDIVHYSLTMARKVGYDNVGTWEWIVTRQGEPFLMEVNTRIQVENGVSARISSIRNHEGPVDLIAEQIRIGLGEPLGYTQDDVTFDGVGIEYRLIAEDPEHGFTPWVGRIERFAWKEEPWLTMLTHVPTDTPYEIPTNSTPTWPWPSSGARIWPRPGNAASPSWTTCTWKAGTTPVKRSSPTWTSCGPTPPAPCASS